jgi:hypothetical protein
MDTASNEPTMETKPQPPVARRRLWKKAIAVVLVLIAFAAYLLRDDVRTLNSLRHIPGTNAYVMDYYGDYHLDEIRDSGMDVDHIEDSLINTRFRRGAAFVARTVKWLFLDEKIEKIPTGDHCSTVCLHAPNGHVLFGRNLDYSHDACLILRVHRGGQVKSVAVLDLHYLNLDRDDLENTTLLRRIPLLLAPYYLQDGMNEYGVAVADMSVDGVQPPHAAGRPEILHSTAMRLILDYAKDVDEAIAILKQYNIHYVAETCHFLLADASGKSCVVEFIDGQMQVTPTNENWQVCTNHQIAGKSEVENDAACPRYQLASSELAALSATAGAADVMRVMQSVSRENWTMWSSVYDLTSHEYHIAYRRHYDHLFDGSMGDE